MNYLLNNLRNTLGEDIARIERHVIEPGNRTELKASDARAAFTLMDMAAATTGKFLSPDASKMVQDAVTVIYGALHPPEVPNILDSTTKLKERIEDLKSTVILRTNTIADLRAEIKELKKRRK